MRGRRIVLAVGLTSHFPARINGFAVAPSKTSVVFAQTRRMPWQLSYSETPEEAEKINIVSSASTNQNMLESKAIKEPSSPSQQKATPTETENDVNQRKIKDSPPSNSKEIKLLLPSTYQNSSVSNTTILPPMEVTKHQKTSSKLQRFNVWDRLRARWRIFVQSQRALNPGMKFRVRLGVALITAVSILSVFLPYGAAARGGKGITSVLAILQRWLSHRGFQGIAALGRSVAYGWALFVAYPRMLDRRAADKKKREREKAVERWRVYLRSLAAEVVRLRQELSSIDSEIRAFRREIISLKATLTNYNNGNTDVDNEKAGSSNQNWNTDIQEGITREMSHLTQLREDTKQALSAARQTWSEMRAKSPLEAWEADDSLLLSLPDSLPPT
jgi:hypothetical protein